MAKAIGWLIVQFDADDVYDRSNKQIIDEVVGPLVQAGIKTSKMVWMKPGYGNQNILYFSANKSFAEKELDDVKKNAPKAAPPWSVKENEEIVESKCFMRLKQVCPVMLILMLCMHVIVSEANWFIPGVRSLSKIGMRLKNC